MGLRIIKTACTDPYKNLATEEYLTMNAPEGLMTLFLWQNARTVVIGRNQNPWRECDIDAIKRDGIRLARRISGGGAVYHDMGNLNFTFIARDDMFDISRQTEVILHACRLLGINAVKTGRNDLTIDGRKFSGHAYYSSKGYDYHHGTIMMDVRGDDLSKYLNASAEKLKSKGVASVRSRVTNLRDHLDEPLRSAPVEELIAAMRSAMEKAASMEYSEASAIEEPPEVPEELIEKYSSEEWRYGTKIPFQKEIEHRFSWGEVQAQLDMTGGVIKASRIYSDSLETETFAVIEKLLTGCAYDPTAIRGLKLPPGISDTGRELLEYIAQSITT